MTDPTPPSTDTPAPKFHALLPLSNLLRDLPFKHSTTLLDLRLPSSTPPKLRILLIYRPSTSSLYAIQPLCPHSSYPLELGDIEDLEPSKPILVCGLHHFDFDLVSGGSTRSECVARTWQARVVQKDGTDWVEVAIDAESVDVARIGKTKFKDPSN